MHLSDLVTLTQCKALDLTYGLGIDDLICPRAPAAQVVNSVSPFCPVPADTRCLKYRHVHVFTVLTNVVELFLFLDFQNLSRPMSRRLHVPK